ncbi:hypothetical protein SeMB42_g06822 [Synchytrium endobioticum]|uniref:Ubiquitin carboxyl-terminal hydrolase n=1 Tax=Synchytrium endobioticum TaxID=286115 RepID=A0A507D147_9FUNG|nr:hypothetical protein SeMB42_g06822 [Synchytrium endobioticum]TPX45179.1 hypothetical protein SeLEV6574_g04027 [Synchytrium endobioticum]
MERIRSLNTSLHLLHPPQSANQWHGCTHLGTARTSSSSQGPTSSMDLNDAYKTCVQYALSYHSRYQISKIVNTKGLGNSRHHDTTPIANTSNTQGTKRKRSDQAELLTFDKLELPLPQCCDCDNVGSRLHACLQCVYLGCWNRGHMSNHLRDQQHTFAMDFAHCRVFCSECNDYIYDADFEMIFNAEKTRLDVLITEIKEGGDFQHKRQKREKQDRRTRYGSWTPPPADQVARMRSAAHVQRCAGIRGMRNLGSSCYMSVILQALIHNPLVRAHFLSSKHSQATCDLNPCIACEMDNLFTECYKGDTSCFAPVSFIHIEPDPLQLLCEVTCHECGQTYTKPDEFLDISLDLSFAARRTGVKNGNNNRSGLEGGGANGISKHGRQSGNIPSNSSSSEVDAYSGIDMYTLSDCLDRYTMPEKLNPNVYFCAKCNKHSDNASKQLSLSRMPPVLTIQLKRFEQYTQQSSKIETPVRIPAELDMTPYSTKSIRETYGKNLHPTSSVVTPLSPSLPKQVKKYDPELDSVPAYRYVLMAVVNHEGKLETGHYTSYNKVRGMWFKFDDANVTSATQKEVLDSKAYMCFYIRETYEYSPISAVEIRSRTSPSNRLQAFQKSNGSSPRTSPPPPLVSTENGIST